MMELIADNPCRKSPIAAGGTATFGQSSIAIEKVIPIIITTWDMSLTGKRIECLAWGV